MGTRCLAVCLYERLRRARQVQRERQSRWPMDRGPEAICWGRPWARNPHGHAGRLRHGEFLAWLARSRRAKACGGTCRSQHVRPNFAHPEAVCDSSVHRPKGQSSRGPGEVACGSNRPRMCRAVHGRLSAGKAGGIDSPPVPLPGWRMPSGTESKSSSPRRRSDSSWIRCQERPCVPPARGQVRDDVGIRAD